MTAHHRKASIDLRYRIAAVASSMIYGIIVSRALGAEGRGTFVFQTLLIQGLCLTFLNGGLGVALQTVCARNPATARRCNRYAVVLSLVFAAVAIVGLLLFQQHGSTPQELISVSLICLGFICTLYQCFAAGMLNGLGEVALRARLEFGQSLALLITAFVLAVVRETSVLAFTIGFYAVLLGSSIIYFRCLYQSHKGSLRGPVNGKQIKELLRFGGRVYVGEVAASGRFQLDQLIISSWFGTAGLGLYQQAQALARRGLLPSQSYAVSSWQPIGQATVAEGKLIVQTTWWKVCKLSVIVLLAGWLLAPIIPVIYGEDFRDAVPLFRLMLPGILLQGSVQVVAVYLFSSLRKPGLVAILNWASVIAQLGLMAMAYSLSPTLTSVAMGAAVSWVLTALLFWAAFLFAKK